VHKCLSSLSNPYIMTTKKFFEARTLVFMRQKKFRKFRKFPKAREGLITALPGFIWVWLSLGIIRLKIGKECSVPPHCSPP
jgi:hypothetical protein